MVKRRIGKIRCVMAIDTILIETGRYVIREFIHTDHAVVARITVIDDTELVMVIGACAKRARRMTYLAILSGRHVFIESGGKRLTGSRNTVTGIALSCQNSRVGVIDRECTSETFSVMARTTICSSI